MHSIHAEFDLTDSAGMSETGAAYIHYVEGVPTLAFMRVEARSYSDIYDLCAALNACASAPAAFECGVAADGHVVCSAAEPWRPYVNTDANTSALCEMLWNILGYDTCIQYTDAREQRAASLPHYSAWFDGIAELAPPTIELLSQQSLSTAGNMVQSVYGCRRTVLLSLKHMNSATAQSYRDVLDLAAQGRSLRLFIGQALKHEAFVDSSGDGDPTPQRMYQGCDVWAADLPLILCETGGSL